MGKRIRSHDWASTVLGPIEAWPAQLKTAVRICLDSRYPMLLLWGRSTLIQLYNDAYISILGAAKHPDWLGRSGRECWAEVWPTIGPMIEGVFASGEATWSEDMLLVLRRNIPREEAYFTFSYSPLPDDSGSVAGVFCAAKETTESVISARRLRTLRDLGQMIQPGNTVSRVCESISEALAANPADVPYSLIYLLDRNQKYANLAAVSRLRAGSGMAPTAIELDKNETHPPWPLRHVMETGLPEVISVAAAGCAGLPGGSWSEPSEVAITLPLISRGQTPAGFLVAGLSPRRSFDADYRGFYDLAANHVATAIANARAYEEERTRAETLEELDRAKTDFFSNVSHEFRTPLTLMLGPLEELLTPESNLPEDHRALVAVTYRNAARLLKLVNTLLDFSRMESGRMQAVYAPTDLGRLTEELASVFRSAVERARLTYRIECDSIHEPIYIDREMWEKIVFNLLSNAFKFTFRGWIAIRLKDIGYAAELEIEDSGVGIPADELPHLFERFHRVENTRGRSFEGSGIGLALVHQLVALHGGAIAVESVVGQGSKFQIRIPKGNLHLNPKRILEAPTQASGTSIGDHYVEEALRWLPEETQDSREDASTGHSGAAGAAIEKPIVLLVDDNSDMQKYVRRLLEPHYRVLIATSGAEALRTLDAVKPNLILSDVMMPDLDGFGLLKAVREAPKTRSIPFIMLSARAGEESRLEGLKASADDYLVKPFTARELLARVNSQLSIAQLHADVEVRERMLREQAEATAEILGKNESRLRRQAEQLKAALDASATGIYRWDPQTNSFLELDENMKHLFCLDSEIRVRTVEELVSRVHPDDRSAVISASHACRSGCDFSMEYRVLMEDGGIRWIYSRGRMQWEDGKPTYLVGACTDITRRKLAEEAAKKSEKLAAAGRLAATMAHEINNPLESVTNLLYLARQDPATSSESREYLELADQQLKRVAQVSRLTLGFYRENAIPTTFDVSQAITELIDVYGYRIHNREIEILQELDSPAELAAPPGEFRQVIANLLINAIDAVPHPGGKIRVRVRATRSWARKWRRGVRITIADNGTGIDPKRRSRIFEAFYTTKQEIGTGLGLWLSRSLVEKHNGFIQLRSCDRPGSSGTVFSIFWPDGRNTETIPA